MKNLTKRIIVIFSLLLVFVSCNRDEDICENGEATARIKLKFKTESTGKLKTLDSIFVKIDYGNGMVGTLEKKSPTDSLLLPLRVDNSNYTDIYIGKKSDEFSLIRFSYTINNEYVSPACGIKRNYINVEGNVLSQNPVKGLQKNQNNIINEEKTHFFVLF